MADSQPAGEGAKPPASERPLGPDGKPIPGPEQVNYLLLALTFVNLID